MIIAISGTPGTGKTRAAERLSKQINGNLISIGKLINKLGCRYDRKRKTRIVDIKKLQKTVDKKTDKKKINIVEGHLSHLLNADRIIILRLNPVKLRRRLLKRGWTKAKVRENVEAEILDEITTEALQNHKRLFEIDVTGLGKEKIVTILTKLCQPKILNKYLEIYQAGKVDWSEKYKKELIRC